MTLKSSKSICPMLLDRRWKPLACHLEPLLKRNTFNMHPCAWWLKTHMYYIISELCTTVHRIIMKCMHASVHDINMGIVKYIFALHTFIFHVLATLHWHPFHDNEDTKRFSLIDFGVKCDLFSWDSPIQNKDVWRSAKVAKNKD